MSNNSILLISADAEISKAVGAAIEKIEGVQFRREEASVAKLNGTAVKLAADNDIVIFATDPSNAADLSAIEVLTAQRGPETVYLALTDGDLPLSKVRALSRSGVDDVLPYPMSTEELHELVDGLLEEKRKAFVERFSGENAARGKLIAVQQARGGIGATTIAVNLADQLQMRRGALKKKPENRVVIVDLDLQFGTVGDFLDLDEQEGLLQLASESFLPDAMWVEQSIARLDNGLSVLAAPQRFAPLEALQPAQIEALIQTLKTMFDYVVVDLPRALVTWIEPVLTEADRLMIVTDMSVPSIRATRRLMDFVLADNVDLSVDVVVNHEKKPVFRAEHHKEAAKALDMPLDHWIPDDPKAARQAVDYGKPLSEIAGRSSIAKGIAALARATIQALPKDQPSARA